jgi:AcrR family transcriptional regulator
MKEMTPRTSDKRKSILNAALSCFTQYGIESTTIEQIRDQADASVGSLYHHFGNKEGIAAALYKEGLRQFMRTLSENMRSVTSIEQMIAATIHANLDWIVENPDWARFIFNHRHVLKDTDQENDFKSEVKAAHQDMTHEWQNLSNYDRLISMPQDVYQSCLIGPTHHYAREWLEGRAETSPQEMSRYLIHMACRCLLTP